MHLLHSFNGHDNLNKPAPECQGMLASAAEDNKGEGADKWNSETYKSRAYLAPAYQLK